MLFRSLDTGFNPGNGANNVVRAIAIQPSDGKVLVAGDFTSFNGVSVSYLARLSPAGAIDGTFLVGTNLNGPVSAVHVQYDGKILVGGSFTAYQTTARNYMARLNADGTLDTGFYSNGTELNNFVNSIDVQTDGAIVIGGGFTAFGSVSRAYFMRLTSAGTLDPSINIGTGADSFVETVLVKGDGKIVLGGSFTNFNGQSAPRLTRINGGINLGEGVIG